MTVMRYEVRVAGRMSELARSAFRGMAVAPVPPETIIYSEVADDDHLHGLLELCQNLGLQVVSVREAPSAAVATSGGRSARQGPAPEWHPDAPDDIVDGNIYALAPDPHTLTAQLQPHPRRAVGRGELVDATHLADLLEQRGVVELATARRHPPCPPVVVGGLRNVQDLQDEAGREVMGPGDARDEAHDHHRAGRPRWRNPRSPRAAPR